jgi:redox-sensing transcriptional repressor
MATKIPHIVIGRLPLYLRVLNRLHKEGKVYASSQELGKLLDISAAQIRKDLSHFGELGKRGTGYHIDFLIDELGKILNTDTIWKMAVVGAGDVGHALANYNGFINRGFEVAAIFDCDPDKVGNQIGDLTIQDCSEMQAVVDQEDIKIAVIATPAEAAQQVAEDLISTGVKAILNYAPIFLKVADDVHVEHIDPAVHLQKLSYYLE